MLTLLLLFVLCFVSCYPNGAPICSVQDEITMGDTGVDIDTPDVVMLAADLESFTPENNLVTLTLSTGSANTMSGFFIQAWSGGLPLTGFIESEMAHTHRNCQRHTLTHKNKLTGSSHTIQFQVPPYTTTTIDFLAVALVHGEVSERTIYRSNTLQISGDSGQAPPQCTASGDECGAGSCLEITFAQASLAKHNGEVYCGTHDACDSVKCPSEQYKCMKVSYMKDLDTDQMDSGDDVYRCVLFELPKNQPDLCKNVFVGEGEECVGQYSCGNFSPVSVVEHFPISVSPDGTCKGKDPCVGPKKRCVEAWLPGDWTPVLGCVAELTALCLTQDDCGEGWSCTGPDLKTFPCAYEADVIPSWEWKTCSPMVDSRPCLDEEARVYKTCVEGTGTGNGSEEGDEEGGGESDSATYSHVMTTLSTVMMALLALL